MARKLLLASAGAGKSRQLALDALARAATGDGVLLITYTRINQAELLNHICNANKVQPKNVAVKGWYEFLLEDLIRPYQRCIVPERIAGIFLDSANPHIRKTPNGKTFHIPGRKEKSEGKWNPLHFVTKRDNRARTFYLAKLAATINDLTGGKPVRRLRDIYNAIYIDEMQDLVGWDYEVLRSLVKTNIAEISCVGDFRQCVYQTSEAPKKPQTSKDKLAAVKAMKFEIYQLAISRRCIQSICDLADRLHSAYGHYDPTKSMIANVPEALAHHCGVFAVNTAHVEDYIKAYSPVLIRWDRSSGVELCRDRMAYTFGRSKGLGFNRVLIIPPRKHAQFLCGDAKAFDGMATDDSRNKLYVGITRARYSVAFIHDGGGLIAGAQHWIPGN